MEGEPAHRVLDGFGATDRAVPLAGGQGTSWRAGDVVLKPVERDAVKTLVWLDWIVRPQLRDTGLRIALPVRGQSGMVVIDGWTATPWLDGGPPTDQWDTTADIARRLASAFAGINPGELPTRNDPWARADRAVWEEWSDSPLRDHPLCPLLRPVNAPLAVVHGDIAGNVLLHPDLPPAVIDLSLYARPVEWSVAVLAIDAVCFEGASLALLDQISTDPAFPQYLARALLFRMTTDVLLGADAPDGRYHPAVTHVLHNAGPQ